MEVFKREKKIKPISKKRISWPSKEELENLVWSKPSTEVAEQLGVSDVAVAKCCKRLGIDKPKRGYWQKLNGTM